MRNRRRKRSKNKKILIVCMIVIAAIAICLAVIGIVKFVTGSRMKAASSNDVSISEDEGLGTEADLTTEQTEAETEQAEGTNTEADTAKIEEQPSWKEDHVKVRGIYVTGPKAGSDGMEDLITLLDETELNTMVIDVKDDSGNITYNMDLNSVQELGVCVNYIRDMDGLLAELKEHDIYTIARIVCFKDDCLAKGRPDLALKTPDGTPVTDANGIMWVNPYSEEVWAYLTEIAQEALDMGFDEVQFDYVRFPVGSVADAAEYGVDMESYTKELAIGGFLSYVKENLSENAVVGADLFGTVIGSEVDKERVGQNYKMLGETVDVLCPMVYPSHYANGVFELSVPDAYPYETVHAALNESVEELSEIEEENRAVVRPWLQSFTATWVDGHISYDGEQIRAQIQAVYDAGYDEWILWNAVNHYSSEGLLPQEEM